MRVGEVVGSYRITGKLGSGGMGAVYLAKHTLIGREAAIKVLLPELCGDESIVARFFNEARTTTAIKHPGIVEIYDFGYARDGSAYLVMERLEGEPLGTRLKRVGRLPIDQALSIARQMCGALMAAHRIGVVHRDLKPDNVYIVQDPEVPGGERAKILDFGIAKLRDKGDGFSAFQTQEGTVMGAPTYMAPEQVAGADKVDHRADQYSVGCILFEMICGRPPFEGRAYGEVMAKQVREPPPRPSSIDPSLPREIDALLLKMLEKRPDARFTDAYDLLQRLHEMSGLPPPSFAGPLVVPPPPTSEEVGSPFESQASADPVDGGPMNITRSAVVSSARLTVALGPRSKGSQPPPIPPLEPVAVRKPPSSPPPPPRKRPGPDALADTMPSPAPASAPPALFAVPSVIPPTLPKAVQSLPTTPPGPLLPPTPIMGPHGVVPPIPASAPTMYDQPRPPPIDFSPQPQPQPPAPPLAREPSQLGAPMMLQPVAPRRSGKLGALVVGIAIAAGGASAYFIATSDDLGDQGGAEPPPVAASEPAKSATAPAVQPPVEATQPASQAAPATAGDAAAGPGPASETPTAGEQPPPKESTAPARDEETNRRPAALITLQIDSLPRGAQVIRKADNVRLGETPFTYETEPQGGSVTFVLRHKGYRDEVVTVPANRSVDRKVPLTRSSGPDRAPSIHDP